MKGFFILLLLTVLWAWYLREHIEVLKAIPTLIAILAGLGIAYIAHIIDKLTD